MSFKIIELELGCLTLVRLWRLKCYNCELMTLLFVVDVLHNDAYIFFDERKKKMLSRKDIKAEKIIGHFFLAHPAFRPR